jgi:hypothetical protein
MLGVSIKDVFYKIGFYALPRVVRSPIFRTFPVEEKEKQENIEEEARSRPTSCSSIYHDVSGELMASNFRVETRKSHTTN